MQTVRTQIRTDNVSPNLDPNSLTLIVLPKELFEKKLILKYSSFTHETLLLPRRLFEEVEQCTQCSVTNTYDLVGVLPFVLGILIKEYFCKQ